MLITLPSQCACHGACGRAQDDGEVADVALVEPAPVGASNVQREIVRRRGPPPMWGRKDALGGRLPGDQEELIGPQGAAAGLEEVFDRGRRAGQDVLTGCEQPVESRDFLLALERPLPGPIRSGQHRQQFQIGAGSFDPSPGPARLVRIEEQPPPVGDREHRHAGASQPSEPRTDPGDGPDVGIFRRVWRSLQHAWVEHPVPRLLDTLPVEELPSFGASYEQGGRLETQVAPDRIESSAHVGQAIVRAEEGSGTLRSPD